MTKVHYIIVIVYNSRSLFAGVNYHVGEALGDTLNQARNNIVSIGIAPWGVIHKREDMIGSEVFINNNRKQKRNYTRNNNIYRSFI